MFIIRNKEDVNIARTIRFYDSIFQKLKRISEIEKTSFNALVLKCCEYALKDYDYKTMSFDEVAKAIKKSE